MYSQKANSDTSAKDQKGKYLISENAIRKCVLSPLKDNYAADVSVPSPLLIPCMDQTFATSRPHQ